MGTVLGPKKEEQTGGG